MIGLLDNGTKRNIRCWFRENNSNEKELYKVGFLLRSGGEYGIMTSDKTSGMIHL